ncbi:MAG: hypothetical protein FWC50_06580 [Planctomycetaceae bacterium]|nr:hypothetical protein [Planctomycetaceae bacterium]
MQKRKIQNKTLKHLILIVVLFLHVPSAFSSDLTNWLWGGKESKTTVSQPYVPPPTAGTQVTTPLTTQFVNPATGQTIPQTQLIVGTPGAVTLPSTGVVATNGVASGSIPIWGNVPSAGVFGNTATIPAVIPTTATTIMQPEVGYQWTFSTIKGVTYEPVQRYNPYTGAVTTSYQERKTESVLPWLHRQEVTTYKPVTLNVPVTNVSGATASVTTDTSFTGFSSTAFPSTMHSTAPAPDIADTKPSLPEIVSPTAHQASYPPVVTARGSAVILPSKLMPAVSSPDATTNAGSLERIIPASGTSSQDTSPVISPVYAEKQQGVSPDKPTPDIQATDKPNDYRPTATVSASATSVPTVPLLQYESQKPLERSASSRSPAGTSPTRLRSSLSTH